MELADALKDINRSKASREMFKADLLRGLVAPPLKRTVLTKIFCRKCKNAVMLDTTTLVIKKDGEYYIQCKRCKAKIDDGIIAVEQEETNEKMFR